MMLRLRPSKGNMKQFMQVHHLRQCYHLARYTPRSIVASTRAVWSSWPSMTTRPGSNRSFDRKASTAIATGPAKPMDDENLIDISYDDVLPEIVTPDEVQIVGTTGTHNEATSTKGKSDGTKRAQSTSFLINRRRRYEKLWSLIQGSRSGGSTKNLMPAFRALYGQQASGEEGLVTAATHGIGGAQAMAPQAHRYFVPPQNLCAALALALLRGRRYTDAREILQDWMMQVFGQGLTKITFSPFVTVCRRVGDRESMQRLWDEIRQDQVDGNAEAASDKHMGTEDHEADNVDRKGRMFVPREISKIRGSLRVYPHLMQHFADFGDTETCDSIYAAFRDLLRCKLQIHHEKQQSSHGLMAMVDQRTDTMGEEKDEESSHTIQVMSETWMHAVRTRYRAHTLKHGVDAGLSLLHSMLQEAPLTLTPADGAQVAPMDTTALTVPLPPLDHHYFTQTFAALWKARRHADIHLLWQRVAVDLAIPCDMSIFGVVLQTLASTTVPGIDDTGAVDDFTAFWREWVKKDDRVSLGIYTIALTHYAHHHPPMHDGVATAASSSLLISTWKDMLTAGVTPTFGTWHSLFNVLWNRLDRDAVMEMLDMHFREAMSVRRENHHETNPEPTKSEHADLPFGQRGCQGGEEERSIKDEVTTGSHRAGSVDENGWLLERRGWTSLLKAYLEGVPVPQYDRYQGLLRHMAQPTPIDLEAPPLHDQPSYDTIESLVQATLTGDAAPFRALDKTPEAMPPIGPLNFAVSNLCNTLSQSHQAPMKLPKGQRYLLPTPTPGKPTMAQRRAYERLVGMLAAAGGAARLPLSMHSVAVLTRCLVDMAASRQDVEAIWRWYEHRRGEMVQHGGGMGSAAQSIQSWVLPGTLPSADELVASDGACSFAVRHRREFLREAIHAYHAWRDPIGVAHVKALLVNRASLPGEDASVTD